MSAQSARQSSAAFFSASERCLTERSYEDETPAIILVPGIVCAVFSIELGFKAIILKSGGSAKGHDLLQLFKKLGTWNQNEITKVMNADRASFMTDLSQMADAFQQWRYVYEHDEVKINIGFLDRLATATQSVASNIVGA